jgi:hypothetical protein
VRLWGVDDEPLTLFRVALLDVGPLRSPPRFAAQRVVTQRSQDFLASDAVVVAPPARCEALPGTGRPLRAEQLIEVRAALPLSSKPYTELSRSSTSSVDRTNAQRLARYLQRCGINCARWASLERRGL